MTATKKAVLYFMDLKHLLYDYTVHDTPSIYDFKKKERLESCVTIGRTKENQGKTENL